MPAIYDRLGQTVRRSKNLGGVLRHASLHGVNVVSVWESPRDNALPHYTVTFYYYGGDYGATDWADWRVLLDWLTAHGIAAPERLTFDSSLWPEVQSDARLARLRDRRGTVITHHAYAKG